MFWQFNIAHPQTNKSIWHKPKDCIALHQYLDVGTNNCALQSDWTCVTDSVCLISTSSADFAAERWNAVSSFSMLFFFLFSSLFFFFTFIFTQGQLWGRLESKWKKHSNMLLPWPESRCFHRVSTAKAAADWKANAVQWSPYFDFDALNFPRPESMSLTLFFKLF